MRSYPNIRSEVQEALQIRDQLIDLSNTFLEAFADKVQKFWSTRYYAMQYISKLSSNCQNYFVSHQNPNDCDIVGLSAFPFPRFRYKMLQ
jgi:hypothetical protein